MSSPRYWHWTSRVRPPPRRPPPRISCAPHVRPPAPRSHGAVFQILHMPYGIRNSEIQNRESGKAISPRCERFYLDDQDDGAVGCAA